MAAFIEGRLAPDELRSVSDHLRGCEECRTVVSETARFEREEQRPANRNWWWLAAAAAVVIALIAIPFFRASRTPIDRLIAAAPHEHRHVEARLSGFPWARLQAPSRGETTPDPADLRLAGAAGEVLEKTGGRGHSAGVAYLLIDRSHESIATLEKSANDAQSWSDLAAARFAVATQEDRPSQFVEALAAADHALRMNPKLPEALFNRALILERMGVREKAREAWQQYLDADPSSEWAVEARAHLHSLGAQSKKFDPKSLDHPDAALVREFPEQARRYGEGPILCAWANGDATALSRARTIADALASFNGEHLLDDAVSAIERANDADRKTLAEAYRIYGPARQAYGKRRSAAEQQLRRAATLFARAHSPMAEVANYFAANTVKDQDRAVEAREQLLALRERIDATRYRALSAQISWTLAVAANSIGDVDTGAREAEAAAMIFNRLGERMNDAFMESVAAYSLELSGNADVAARHRAKALETYCGGDNRSLCNGVLDETASALTLIDRTEEALALTNATTAFRGDDPFVTTCQAVNRARVAGRGRIESAAHDAIREARAALAQVSDQALHDAMRAQIDIEEASLMRAREPLRALDVLNRSVDFLRSRDVRYLMPYAWLQRARTLAASGDQPKALADYHAALREVETQQSQNLSIAFLDTARQVVDETIELELSRGAVDEAFRVSDARHQLTSGGHGARLPAGTAAIEYAVLSRGLAIFCVTRSGVIAQRVDVDHRELDARIDAFTGAVRRRAPIEAVRSASAAVYALLVAPVRSQLESSDTLIIVPDRELFAVPFASLYDEKSARYLIEDFDVRFAPAVSSLADAAPDALTPALVVGDPPTSHPRLRDGREEAEEIASLNRGTLLTGNAATRAAFTETARRSALIYFAGHAESDAIESNAALLLANGASLDESDIVHLRLERRPLVVLAACGTFRGDAMHVAGMSSLSRAFLIAGARAVVGTLWEVDDDIASAFFLRFHENLRGDPSPSHALRDAQRAMLHSSDPRLMHPATWAPVELLSGTL
ncbi:MAG TPA: CHAT domain-containing protein [Thermoanaerobaculia bacterium]|nr:CHAT domain-containing protein [Thermoanaerobaculia bacterium]